MKKGQYKRLRIPTNRFGESIEIDSEYLSKGEFATCYKSGEWVYSFVKNGEKESDYSKQAIAVFVDNKNPHIPNFERLEDLEGFDGEINTQYLIMIFRLLKNNRL